MENADELVPVIRRVIGAHIEDQLVNYDRDGRNECGCHTQGDRQSYRDHLAVEIAAAVRSFSVL